MKKILAVLLLFLAPCFISCDNKEVIIETLSDNIRTLFDMAGTRAKDKSEVRIEKSVASFSDVYNAIYAQLNEDPTNRKIKKTVSRFNKNMRTLEVNLCTLLQSVEDGEINHRAAERVFISLENLKNNVEDSTLIEDTLKIRFVKSVKIIVISATSIISLMFINKVYNMMKPDKKEEEFVETLDVIEDGMEQVSGKAKEAGTFAERALNTTARTLEVTVNTERAVGELGKRVGTALEDYESRIEALEKKKVPIKELQEPQQAELPKQPLVTVPEASKKWFKFG